MHLDPLALQIASLAVAAFTALVLGLASFRTRRHALATRLAEFAQGTASPFAPAQAVPATPTQAGALRRALASVAWLARPSRREELVRLESRLQQAGIRGASSVTAYLATKIALPTGFLGALLLYNASKADHIEPVFVVGVVVFAAGFYLPDLWLSSRTRSRQTQIERALPDALDLLVTCVEAGLGLDAALQRVADEIRLAWPELSGEFRTTFLEVKAGMPRIEAFRRLAARTGVRDLKSLSATLTQTEIFGTSVAIALRVQAEGIRVRRMQRAEEKAAYVGVKMTLPLVLCILPSLMAIIVGPAIINIAQQLLPWLGGKR
ncbi:type II secretion system F family protein [Anaeromyxobacter oryzae]|uniref:Type II secretion system protein GspF domain-containing protein n=1 Tax=Anaeromyxobacter oryzae TaxID=2918170 RepID=A0ABM7WP31_9BACT|nr:type II secretion system F family protein [Anaeromyxobacter oryzae]BDG01210.1 hypothetical protein AMOR_02060 [Anaeromyxobacter oryzae]